MTAPTTLPDALAEIEELRGQVRDLLQLLGQEAKPKAAGGGASPVKTTDAHEFSEGLVPRQTGKDAAQHLLNLHQMIETVPDIIFTLDLQGNLVGWNRRLQIVTGFTPQELNGRPALAFVPEHEHAQTAAAIQRAFEDGYAELEGHMLTKAQLTIPYHWTGAALKNEEGRVIGITGVGRDVSEKRRIQAELKRQRQQLLSGQALAHVGSWEWDISSGDMEWSEEQFRIFGHEPGTVPTTYETFLAAVLPDDHDRVTTGLSTALMGQKTLDIECRIVRPTGEVRSIHCRGEIVPSHAGHPARMSGSTLDITDRKQAESALRQSETHFRALIENSSDIITVLDSDGTIRFESPSFERLFGFAQHEIDGLIAFDFIHPDDLPTVLEKFQLVVQRPGEAQTAEFRFRHKDGSWLVLEGIGRSILDTEGQRYVIVNSRDVTERKRAQVALARSHDLLTSFVEHTPAAVAMLDKNLRYVAVSRRWVQDYRLDEQDLIGRHHYDVFPEIRVMEEWQAIHRRCLAGAVERCDEDRFIRADGSEDWLRWEVRPWREASGTIGGIIIFTEVITERKQVQEELKLFRTLLDQVTDSIEVIESSSGRFLDGNRQSYESIGYTRSELLALTVPDIDPVVSKPVFQEYMQRLREADAPLRIESVHLRKDGTTFPVEVVAQIIRHDREYLVAVVRDITERKRTEAALRISQERYARATAIGKVGIWELDAVTGLYHGDVNLKALFGYEPDELSTDPYEWLGLVHPDDQAIALKAWEGIVSRSTDDYYYELRMIRKDGTLIWTDVRGHAERDEHGQVQRLIGATVDVTERKQADTALRISQMKLRQAIEASNTGLWDWNTATNEVTFSPEWKRQLGYGAEEISDRFEEWESRLHPDDKKRVLAYARSYRENTNGDYTQEFRLRNKDGSYRWVAARASFVPEPTGQRVRLLGAQMDISARKQAEGMLALENRLLERVAEGLPLSGILDQLSRGIEAIAQDSLCSILLMEKDGLHLRHGAAPNLPASYTAAIDGVAIGPSVGSCGTAAYENKLIVVEDIATDPLWTNYKELALHHGLQACWSIPITSSAGEMLGTFAVYYRNPRRPADGDIQLIEQAARLAQIAIERKQAEQALRASEEKLRQSLLASNTGLWDWNTETNEVWLSREWKGQLGYEAAELPDTFESWESRLHPDDHARAVAYAIRYRDNPVGAFRQDFRLLHKDGSYRWIDSHASFVTEPDGRRVRLLGSHTDITDRKQAEETLSESEARFRTLVSNIPGAIYRCAVDREWTMSYLSNSIEDIVGYPAAEFIGNHTRSYASVIHPDDRQLVEDTVWAGLRGRCPYVLEYRMIHANGTVRWVYEKGQGVFTPDGEMRFLDGAIFDITERKQAEELLRLTQFSVDRAVDGVFWVAPDGRILSVNEAACRMLEYSSQELTAMTVHDIEPLFPPESWPGHWEELKQKGSMTFESKHWSSTGRVLDTEVTVNYLRYGGNEYNCAIMRDIGERKRVEAELRRSHTFLRQVIDTTPNFIFAKDRDGRFTLVNKALADAYGTTVDSLFGKTEADFNPNRDEVAFFAKKDLEVLDSLQERFIPEEKITDATGQIRWLQTVKRPLLDDTGRATMVLGASTDITARKGVELALRRRESDLQAAMAERERISEDLHDGILQSIYAIGLGLEACKPLIADQPKRSAVKLKTELQRTIGQLNHVLEEVRNFIAGLESHILDGQEFDTVLRTMGHALAASYSVPCRVTVEKAAASQLSTEQAYHVMNVAREALSNSFRHSHARRITLSLKRLSRSVRLSVIDNGVGFNPSAVRDTGHGLANMASRASKVGGTFTLLSKPRGGTKVVLDLPMRCTDASG